jgi:hypothetical protein
MDIIIDRSNPVKVIDQDGFVLLDYKPIEHLDNMTVDEIDEYLKDSVTY